MEHRVLSESKVSSWSDWWKKHKDKSLLEMQIAVAESSLSILKSAKKGSGLASWGSRQVKGIEQMIQELKKGGRPKARVLDDDIHLVKRSHVTTIDGEERYSFYNGK